MPVLLSERRFVKPSSVYKLLPSVLYKFRCVIRAHNLSTSVLAYPRFLVNVRTVRACVCICECVINRQDPLKDQLAGNPCVK